RTRRHLATDHLDDIADRDGLLPTVSRRALAQRYHRWASRRRNVVRRHALGEANRHSCRRSITRFAFPSDRSIEPAATRRTAAVTPTRSLTLAEIVVPIASSCSFASETPSLSSDTIVSSSSRPSRLSSSW